MATRHRRHHFVATRERLAQVVSTAFDPLVNEHTFSSWLVGEVQAQIERDPVLRCRVEIQKLKREHREKRREYFQQKTDSDELYKLCSDFAAITTLSAEVNSLQKKTQGFRDFLVNPRKNTTDDKLTQVQANLEEAEALLLAKQQELADKQQGCVEFQNFERDCKQASDFDVEIGITGLRQELELGNKSLGEVRGTSGEKFEDLSLCAVREVIVPQLRKRFAIAPEATLELLTNVSLGMACGELDIVVVQRISDNTNTTNDENDQPCYVRVLAIVECKNSLSEIGESYKIHKKTLMFLTHHPAHNAETMVCKTYRSGEFRFKEDTVKHVQTKGNKVYSKYADEEDEFVKVGNGTYLFREDSFALLKDDERGDFLDALYFVARAPPAISHLHTIVGRDSENANENEKTNSNSTTTDDWNRVLCTIPSKMIAILRIRFANNDESDVSTGACDPSLFLRTKEEMDAQPTPTLKLLKMFLDKNEGDGHEHIVLVYKRPFIDSEQTKSGGDEDAVAGDGQ